MFLKVLTAISFLLTIELATDIGDLKRILRSIEKNDLDKAWDLIDKSLMEHPANPGVKWIASHLTSTDSLPNYNLDSARDLVVEALKDFDLIDQDYLVDFEELGFTRDTILATAKSIETATYFEFVNQNTVQAMNQFLLIYPDSHYKIETLKKRDSLAFLDTKSVNSWQAYQNYLTNYSNSTYADSATYNYELLLFRTKTSSGSLQDHEEFVKNYPSNPYRKESIKYLFRFGTLDHDPTTFLKFISKYPDSPEATKSANILYYLDFQKWIKNSEMMGEKLVDSTFEVRNSNTNWVIPKFSPEGISFSNKYGESFLAGQFDSLTTEQYCLDITGDFIAGWQNQKLKVINRMGTKIIEGDLDYIKEIGLGSVYYEGNSGALIHKSGFQIIEDIEDAEIFLNRWIKVKRNEKWGVVSFSGEMISDFRFEKIFEKGQFVVFDRGESIALSNPEKISSDVDRNGFSLEFKYEEIEFVNDSTVIGFKENRECLVDQNLNFLIPWGNHTIYPDSKVRYSKIQNGSFEIYDDNGFSEVKEIFTTDHWLLTKQENWSAKSLVSQVELNELDSVKLINDFAVFGKQLDSSFIVFPNGQRIASATDQRTFEINSPSRKTNFLVISLEKFHSIWGENGDFLFQGHFDKISCLSDSLFKVKIDDKEGIIDQSGFYVLEPEYDFINYQDNMAMILKKGKIGVYDFLKGAKIDPKYEAAFIRFGDLFGTKYEDKWGVINTDEAELLPFEYEEISPVSENILWVKTDSSWSLLDQFKEEMILPNVHSKSDIYTKEGTFFRFLTDKGYGIVDQMGKAIISANFSDIRLIGSENQYFMGEHFVPEADYYVIVAYNLDGTKIFTQALRLEDYDKIYCE